MFARNSAATANGPSAGATRRGMIAGCLLLLLACSGATLAATRNDAIDDGVNLSPSAARAVRPGDLPAGIRVLRDIAYGPDPLQRFDVYAPAGANNAPVILMVHGGGWMRGDKAMRGVVENKVKRWVPRGFILVSVDYRLVPAVDPLEEAQDVARVLAKAQHDAATWGGDAHKFILMGHSAGAHLVALLDASPARLRDAGAVAPLGSVLLDSAALDVPRIMDAPHLSLYDRAFGRDAALWQAASPLAQLRQKTPPILAVCSSRRHISCTQAQHFVAKAVSFGSRARMLAENRTHGEINAQLGVPGAYTDAVEEFLGSLDPAVAARLRAR